MAYDNEVRERGVYIVRDNNHVMYIGSSKCMLSTLEYNHRNWKEKYGLEGRTNFREALITEGRKWDFEWLIEPFRCDAETIEHIEGCLIRQLTPELNWDKDPVASSKKYGRY
jgi:hypothetical protein